MKKLLAVLLIAFVYTGVNAQYYYNPQINAGENPGGINTDSEFPNGGGLDASWSLILATQTTPTWSSQQTIPFAFEFNGDTVSSYYVSTSGVLTFSSNPGNAPGYQNSNLPDASIPDSSICVWGLEPIGNNDDIMGKTFGSAPNRQHWVFFTSYGHYGAGSTAWTYWSIVLEETTNNIYIVDQRTGNTTTALTLGIQIDFSTYLEVAGSPNIANNAGTDETPNDNSYYEFFPGTRPPIDLGVTEFQMAPFLDNNNAPFAIDGKIINFGADTITQFTLSYQVNNGAPVSANITGVSIPTNGSYNFSHPTPWAPATSGNYTIKLYSSLPNNLPDTINYNDTLLSSTTVLDTLINKKVVLEEGTGAWCGYCPDGAVVVENILASNNNVIAVAIHNSDAMAFSTGNTINSAYANGYPNGWVDRYLFPQYSSVGQSRGNWSSMVNERLAMSYPVYVEATNNYAARQITIDLTAKFFANLSGDYRVNAYIIEDSVSGTGTGYNQSNYYNSTVGHPMYGLGNPIIGYQHRHVLRAMLGGPWGSTGVIPANINKNDEFTHSYSYIVPNDINPNRLSIVVLVQHYDGVDINNREILNAEEYHLGYIDIVDNIKNNGELLAVYPNPANDLINVEYLLIETSDVSFSLFDMLGNTIKFENAGSMPAGEFNHSISLSDVAKGVYVLKVNIGNNILTKKVQVK